MPVGACESCGVFCAGPASLKPLLRVLKVCAWGVQGGLITGGTGGLPTVAGVAGGEVNDPAGLDGNCNAFGAKPNPGMKAPAARAVKGPQPETKRYNKLAIII